MSKIKRTVALLLVIGMVFSLTGCRIKDGNTDEKPAQEAAAAPEASAADQETAVQVSGEDVGEIRDVEEAEAPDAAEQSQETETDGGDSSAEIVVSEDMGIGGL